MPVSRSFDYVYARSSADAWKKARQKYSSKVVTNVTLTHNLRGEIYRYMGKKRYTVELKGRKK